MIRSSNEASQGVVYYAVGKACCREATQSAASVKQQMPELSTAIFCDQPVPEDVFNYQLPIDTSLSVKRQKLRSLQLSPYEKTLYLDTDTYLADAIWEIFDLLERFEFAVSLSPWWSVPLGQSRGQAFEDGVPIAFPKYNAGVIAFRKSVPVIRFFEAWERIYIDRGNTGQDQNSFRIAIYESDLRWATLPPAYNYRLPFPCGIRGGIKILHGRHARMPELCRHLNRTRAFRSSAPVGFKPNAYYFGKAGLQPSLREELESRLKAGIRVLMRME